MILATDYPFLDIVGTMLVFFVWIMWFWLLIIILMDVFSRDDLSGWGKAGWTLLVLIIPIIGVLIYLIAHGSDMGERRADQAARMQKSQDDYIRQVASSDAPATQIAQAKQLLDSGAIDEAEFAKLKARALA
jgi:hypothetical protein